MVEVRIVPALEDHLGDLVLRQADVDEIWASSAADSQAALTRTLGVSTRAWSGYADDELVVMFGVARASLLGGIGVPWMVASDSLEGHAIRFLRRCRPYVREMLDGFVVLMNFVDARNTTAIKWLEWCGFTIFDPTPYGPFRMPFHRFEVRA